MDEDFLNDYLYSPLKSDYEDRWNDEHSKEVSQYEVHGHVVTPDDYIKATVNFDYIKSDEYRNKFLSLRKSPDLTVAIRNCAKKLLELYSGTLFEGMYWLDQNGNKKAEILEAKEILTVKGNPIVDKIVNDNPGMIAIHNHPLSSPPSAVDFNKAAKFGYSPGIIVCHDGTLYEYTMEKGKNITQRAIEKQAILYKEETKDIGEARLLGIFDIADNYRISIREVL